MSATLQVGDDHTPIVFSFVRPDGAPADLAGGAATLRVTRTDGTTADRAAFVVGDGSAGQVQSYLLAADAPVPGTVLVQAGVVFAGVTAYSRVEKLKAKASL